MSKEKTNITRLGIFVTATFLLFIVAVYNIGNKENLFGSTFRISCIFQNVNGLQPGNNVRYAGIKVGSVKDIVFLNDSTLQVEMLMERKVQAYLKKDAIASIGSDGLVGNVIVNISPGKGDMPAVEDGDVLQSYTRIKPEDMINKLGNTTENIALLTLNLLEISENLNNGIGSIPMLIKDSIVAKDIQSTIRNLRQTSQEVNALSSQFSQRMKQVNEGEGVLGYLLTDTTFEYQINQITQGMDTLIRNRTAPIMTNLERSSKDLASTTAELKDLIHQIDLNQGLVGTVLQDTALSEDLKQTMQHLNEGTDRFNENMEALKHNFLFRKYFKKQEKERKKEEQQDLTVQY